LRRINPRRSIPTFVIGGRIRVGFSPTGILNTIRAAKATPSDS